MMVSVQSMLNGWLTMVSQWSMLMSGSSRESGCLMIVTLMLKLHGQSMIHRTRCGKACAGMANDRDEWQIQPLWLIGTCLSGQEKAPSIWFLNGYLLVTKGYYCLLVSN